MMIAAAESLKVPAPAMEVIASDLPPGCGLGSSGALSVAIAYATGLSAGLRLDPKRVVPIACGAEHTAGINGGTQDQLASAHGGAGLVERYTDLGTRSDLQIDIHALSELLSIVQCGGSRNSGHIIEAVIERQNDPAAAAVITEMSHIGLSMAAALEANDFGTFVWCVRESCRLLAALHPKIVDEEIRQAFEGDGALASKPCGAGGPGAAWIVITEPGRREHFRSIASQRGFQILDASFAIRGVRAIQPDERIQA